MRGPEAIPAIIVVIPRDVETDDWRERQRCLARAVAPIAAALPAAILPPILMLAAHLAWRCIPTLISQVFP